MKNVTLYLISFTAFGIVVLREFYPSLRFDGVSLALLGIAALALSLPRLIEILPPLKKAKFKDFEIEFEKEIEVLEEQVVQIEKEAEKSEIKDTSKYPPLHSAYVEEYQNIISAKEPNMQKVLRAAILTEKIVVQTVKDLDIEVKGNIKSPAVVIKSLVDEGVITENERVVFNTFWDLRNKVVHGHLSELTDSQTTRIMSLLWRLITIFG